MLGRSSKKIYQDINGKIINPTSFSFPSDERTLYNNYMKNLGRFPANIYQCAKPSRSGRETGLDDLQVKGQMKRFIGKKELQVLRIHEQEQEELQAK